MCCWFICWFICCCFWGWVDTADVKMTVITDIRALVLTVHLTLHHLFKRPYTRLGPKTTQISVIYQPMMSAVWHSAAATHATSGIATADTVSQVICHLGLGTEVLLRMSMGNLSIIRTTIPGDRRERTLPRNGPSINSVAVKFGYSRRVLNRCLVDSAFWNLLSVAQCCIFFNWAVLASSGIGKRALVWIPCSSNYRQSRACIRLYLARYQSSTRYLVFFGKYWYRVLVPMLVCARAALSPKRVEIKCAPSVRVSERTRKCRDSIVHNSVIRMVTHL